MKKTAMKLLLSPDEFSVVREALEAAGVAMAQAEVTMIPQNYVDINR